MVMKNKWIILFLFFGILCSCGSKDVRLEVVAQEYIEQWKLFYPSKAFSFGDLKSAFEFEDFSLKKIQSWIGFNKKILETLKSLPEDLPADKKIDAGLLERQILDELEKWEKDRIFENSPLFYAGMISQALTYVLARDELSPPERWVAVDKRLAGIRDLCAEGIILLKKGSPHNTERSISVLESTAYFYEESLLSITREWPQESAPHAFQEMCLETATSIRALSDHIQHKVERSLPDSMGRKSYANKLKIFTGMDISPEELEEISFEEIKEVRSLMKEAAADFWKERYPRKKPPQDFTGLIARTIEDMEANRESDQQGFLDIFVSLIDRAENFVREKNIATLPEKRTLFTALSPSHFAGAAVGGVYPAGPFNPDAQTLFYLPSVPDDAEEKVKEGFYRSFNNHFNTMIITHEIYPGHYMQLKIASKNPHIIRALFADGLYAEGWATLCEVITLDEGWNGFDKLDRLAHLRKRLENATRAYTSVQAHCRGWDEDKIQDFAVKEGLLAPQFAHNLWDRITASPLQLISYFLGFKMFSELLRAEKKRLGQKFSMQRFCDTVLQSGAVPIDSLSSVFGD
jgi:hypothetical protein